MKKFFITLSLALVLMTTGAQAVASPAVAHDGVASSISAQPMAKPVQGGVELYVPADGTETFTVYSITGQVIKTVNVAQGSTFVELPKGCYIIKCARWSKKVVVK